MEKQEKVKNIRELAALLNLSITTVSRVLNGKAKLYRISKSTSDRVFEAAHNLQYTPNRIARGLKMEKSETLGLIVPDISNPFFASIARTIEIEARKKGYSLLYCDSMEDENSEKELIQLMVSRKVDGLIIAPVGSESIHIDDIIKQQTPVLVIDRYFPKKTISYITTDNHLGAFKAVEYMIQCGHRNIACIQGIPHTSPNIDRMQGYKDALKRYDIPFHEELIIGTDFGEENGYISTKHLMSKPSKPTAIFAFSNLIALGAIRAANELKLQIPDQMSLLSFDEQPYSAFLACPLSTIEQKKEAIAVLAVDHLLKIINGELKDSLTSIKIAPSLIIRDSVKKIT